MTHCSRWESVLLCYHDLGHVFDPINTATAMHRIAKLTRRAKVSSTIDNVAQPSPDGATTTALHRTNRHAPKSQQHALYYISSNMVK